MFSYNTSTTENIERTKLISVEIGKFASIYTNFFTKLSFYLMIGGVEICLPLHHFNL